MAIGTALTDPTPEFEASGLAADIWHDMGIALVWIVVLLAPLAFRRGWAGALVLVLFAGATLLPAAPARADIGDWFQRPDQRAANAFDAGHHTEAAERFEDPAWRAAALYRSERYDEAAALLGEAEDATGQYNLGNSLARAGQLEAAIAAYDRVLDRSATHEDAEFNRELVRKLLEEQQEQQSQPPQSSDSSPGDESQDGESEAGDASGNGESDPSAATGESDERSDEHEQAAAGAPPPGESANDASAEAQAPEPSGSESAASDPVEGDEAKDAADAAEHSGEPPSERDAGDTPAEPSSDMANQPLSEREQAIEQWLGRVSADPGGLLREKLRRKYAEERYRGALRRTQR
jgi:Ca-activated chloride channel family protein